MDGFLGVTNRMLNTFNADDKWEKEVRNKYLIPFYNITFNNKYVLCDKGRSATLLQKRFDIDTIAQHPDGQNVIMIEEKFQRKSWGSLFLETKSCTNPGRESPGWMSYCEADLLVYIFVDREIELYMYHFQELKDWFWRQEKNVTWITKRTNQSNHTEGKIVPLKSIPTDFLFYKGIL